MIKWSNIDRYISKVEINCILLNVTIISFLLY